MLELRKSRGISETRRPWLRSKGRKKRDAKSYHHFTDTALYGRLGSDSPLNRRCTITVIGLSKVLSEWRNMQDATGTQTMIQHPNEILPPSLTSAKNRWLRKA